MAKLIYLFNATLDGYIENQQGEIFPGAPSEEVHRFINDLVRPIGTYLYGRRLYKTMAFWDTPAGVEDQPEYVRDFAHIWRQAQKVVYSRTLTAPEGEKTRLESRFDVDEVKALKTAADSDMTIGGANLGGQALRAGLVDEIQVLIHPLIIGGGKPGLPQDAALQLELLGERRFGDGVIYLRYRVAS